ncbi:MULTISPECIES: DoxX family membrane protein [Kitasatospora]|uniref:Membrane protein YphA (DoxX/SURF4 family) n=2 Tax=Kitasatospora TaxID=2063 RepID=A0ABT1J2I0_9ACTN|nr:DoxX family membrane protein [Kitasatospora paracochleata]MCP2311640.1 putative membrane protein YphA (DoxX/SURF4 family) [Kitasatospora paracochleata]
MAIVRICARPLLASMFLVGGADAVRHPEPLVPAARPVVESLDELPVVPDRVATAVRLNGGVQTVAALMLAFGRMPRLAAAVLAATLVPVTAAGHRFWEAEGDDRRQQRIHFLKNLSMLGGLLIAAGEPTRRPARRGTVALAQLRDHLPG